MAPLPTKSRIFADRYCRDLRRREAAYSQTISPGTDNWADAVRAFFERVGQAGSPVKRASLVYRMTEYLNDTIGDGAHFILDAGGRNRSAGLMFATLSAGENPFLGVDEEGVNVTKHYLVTRRNGEVAMLPDVVIAYVSKHAIGRLHERGHDLTNNKATCVLACVGILGLLTRDSAKHVDSGLCLNYDGTLIVGSLKHAMKSLSNGHEVNGTVFDVRTALLADLVTDQAMLRQGAFATHAVANWLDDRSVNPVTNRKLAEPIPFMPRREDYTTIHAIEDLKRSNTP